MWDDFGESQDYSAVTHRVVAKIASPFVSRREDVALYGTRVGVACAEVHPSPSGVVVAFSSARGVQVLGCCGGEGAQVMAGLGGAAAVRRWMRACASRPRLTRTASGARARRSRGLAACKALASRAAPPQAPTRRRRTTTTPWSAPTRTRARSAARQRGLLGYLWAAPERVPPADGTGPRQAEKPSATRRRWESAAPQR